MKTNKKITLKKLKEIGARADKYLDQLDKEICLNKPPNKFTWSTLQDLYDINFVMSYLAWIPTIHELDSARFNKEILKVIERMRDFYTTAREDLIPAWAWKFVEDSDYTYEII